MRRHENGLLFVSLSTAILGTAQTLYQNSALNNVELPVKKFITQSFQIHYGQNISSNQLTSIYSYGVVGIWGLGAVVGSLLATPLADRFGRRNAVALWPSLLTLLACAVIFLSKPLVAFELLILGRFLCGVSAGCLLTSYGTYITEVAPDHARGLFGSCKFIPHVLVNVLVLILGLPQVLGTDELWVFVVGFGMWPALLNLLLTPFFPETPKFLYINLDDPSAAAEGVVYFQGPNAPLEAILAEFEHEKQLANVGGKKTASLSKILHLRHLRIPLFLSILAGVSQDTGGYDFVTNYSTEIYSKLGLSQESSQYATIISYIPGILAASFTIWKIESIGRRPLLLFSLVLGSAGCLILLLTEVLEVYWAPLSYVSILGIISIIVAFYMGSGPIPEFIFGELTPQASRSITGSISLATDWSLTFFYAGTFTPFHEVLGPWVQLYAIIPNMLAFAYLYRKLPETKGRPVDEIVNGFKLIDNDEETLPLCTNP